MKLSKRLKQQEGRKLEFKEVLPSKSNLAKTVVAFAKIECARFKGTVPGNFIDQKTIEVSIATQAEEAFNFVLRHISQGTTGYNGVYRQDWWEYPLEAIREVIRKAIHLKARRKLGRKLGSELGRKFCLF